MSTDSGFSSLKTRRIVPFVGLSAHLGRGIQRVAIDAIIGRARSLPRKVGDLDAAALSRIMGRTVTTVSVIGGDAGTSSRARLALTGNEVADTVFVKMPAETAATRLIGELGRLAHTEVHFYDQLSAELAGVPKSYGSAFDALTGRYVLVLEDLPPEQCEFPDTLHPRRPDKASVRFVSASLNCTQPFGTGYRPDAAPARSGGSIPPPATTPRY